MMLASIQMSLLEYEGRPFERGLSVSVYAPSVPVDGSQWSILRRVVSEIEKSAGPQSVAIQQGSIILCIPMNVSAVKPKVTVRDFDNEITWNLIDEARTLNPMNPSERDAIRLLVAKAISNQQLARGWFVEAYRRVYYWSFTLSERLSMGNMDVYPGFIFRPYIYEDGSCAVVLDPKFRFVSRVTIRDIVDEMISKGKTRRDIQSEFANSTVIDACPIIDCPFRKDPSSLCRLRGAGKKYTLLELDFGRTPSGAKFGNLIKYHTRDVCPNKGILGENIKDKEPIAQVERTNFGQVLEFPLERLRKELALKELDRFGRFFVSKYVRPSAKERWYLTRGFIAYLDGLKMGRMHQLKIISRLVVAGDKDRPWSNYGSFSETPLKFRDSNTGTEPFSYLERYGPYDLSDGRYRRKFDELSLSIHNFSKTLTVEDIRRFYNDLTKGLVRSNYPGLEKLFKLFIPSFREGFVKSNTYELDANVRRQPHIVIIITEATGNKNVLQYKPFKQKLTKIGVPCQFVLEQNIGRNASNQKYAGYLRNLALNIYAKAGGIPWILGRPISENKCFIGLSARSKLGKIYFSIQVFNSEGFWLGGHVYRVNKERYSQELSAALDIAVSTYTSNQKEEPNEVVVHRDGEIWEKLELAALNEANKKPRIVTVKQTGLPRLYDMNVPSSLIVGRGIYVQFDSNAAVLSTSGAPHNIQGTQRPIVIELENGRSTSSLLRETCREVFLLSLVFSGYTLAVTADPVTTHFAGKAANLSSLHDLEEDSSLHRIAWFL
jgi:hypothetical protein